MLEIVLTVGFIIVFMIGIFLQVSRRRQAGMTGIRSAISPICFMLSAALNPLGYWLGFLGMYSLLGSMLFLLLGAYFVKYMHVPRERVSKE